MARNAQTEALKQRFLEEYPGIGVITQTARQIGTTPAAVAQWRRTDPEFEEAFKLACEEATDNLEAEARERALGKWVDKFNSKTGEVVHVLEHSDALLMFLLKGHRARTFKDRVASEISGPDGQPIESNVGLQGAARLHAMLEEARRRKEAGEDAVDPFS
jgi:hypothetical protein